MLNLEPGENAEIIEAHPAEIFGIPVYVTDAIVNNEPIVA